MSIHAIHTYKEEKESKKGVVIIQEDTKIVNDLGSCGRHVELVVLEKVKLSVNTRF